MKNKIGLIAITIILLGVTAIFFNNTKEKTNMKLRVAFPYNKTVDAYEPTKIHLAPEYIFLENMEDIDFYYLFLFI